MKHVLLVFATGLFFFHSVSCSAGSNSEKGSEAMLAANAATPENSYAVIELNEDSFVEKVFDFRNSEEWSFKGDKPAIIDFYAVWCGPCKRLAPVLVELQQEYGDKIQIYKVDAEKNRQLAAAFGVTAYPTMLFIPMGADPAGAKGLLPKEELERIIGEFLKVSK
jgi:thioredoxin 1